MGVSPDGDLHYREPATYQDVLPGDGSIHHSARQSYLERHVAKLLQSVHEGVPLKGHLLWSLLDKFEGLFEKTLKQSGQWHNVFLKGERV